MPDLIRTLRSIKPSLDQKRVIPTRAWSPLSAYTRMDKAKLAIKLASLSMVDHRNLEQEKLSIDSTIDNYTRELKTHKKKSKELEEKIAHARNSNNPLIKQKEIDRIMNNLLIQHFEFVDPAVTVFTTEFIKKGTRVLGIFRIWIDWSKPDPGDGGGVRIINVYKRTPGYDHPCISSGKLCMGDAAETIKKHFRERNVYILLETLIAFLVSENVSHGYIRTWENWSSQCSRLTKELTFADLGIQPGTSMNGANATRIMGELINQLNQQYQIDNHGDLQEAQSIGAI